MEKEMAPHSSTLAWKIPWTEEPGRLQSMGSLRVGHWSDFPFTFHLHALEKEMAAHSSVLAWRIPGTAEPGGLPSMGSHRVGHDCSDLAAAAAGFESLKLQVNSIHCCHDDKESPLPAGGNSRTWATVGLCRIYWKATPEGEGVLKQPEDTFCL